MRILQQDGRTTLEFEGVLDRVALERVLDARRRARTDTGEVAVRLLAGTQVEAACIEDLARACPGAVSAESPFVASWLASIAAGR